MLPIPSRHRSLALFGIALAAQVMLLAIQIRRGQQARLIRVWAIESVSPLGRGAAWSVDGVRGMWNNYVALRHMREENDQLRNELGALKLRNAELESHAAEAERLSQLLGFRDAHAEVQMLAARVIGAGPDPASRMVFIDRGTRDGVKRDMGVITPEGVVGKILAVYPDTSQVLLLTDKESGVGALLGSSRSQGPVRGSGDPLLGLEYISNDVKVAPGEAVLTSGQDRIFPKDLPVGTVADVQTDRKGPFQKISVRPAAKLDGLEEVLVLLTRQEFAPRKSSDALAVGPLAQTTASKSPVPAAAPSSAKAIPKPPAATGSQAPSIINSKQTAPAAAPATIKSKEPELPATPAPKNADEGERN